uniref:Internal scaffolding protein n=1 Tax=Dulem virus 134 TaxID=3145611 RepID=A0AAU8B9K0_9VIRU
MFKTQFDSHSRVLQEPGCGERVLYMSKLADDGTVELTPSGTEDLYASIQSHKDSCDIHVLLLRYQNGDVDALSRVQGAYGDFTQLPGTYAELLNAMIAGEQYFNSLPVETRAKFDHSFEKFMVSMDNMPDFLSRLGVSLPTDDLPVASKSEDLVSEDKKGE